MTRTLLGLALAQWFVGVVLYALLPHLGLGYHAALAGVALVGALWIGGAGTAVMAVAAGLVGGWQRWKAQ